MVGSRFALRLLAALPLIVASQIAYAQSNATNFKAQTLSDSSIKLTWSAPGGSYTGYVIAVNATGTAPATTCKSADKLYTIGKATTYTVSDLAVATLHSIRLCTTKFLSRSSGVLASATTGAAIEGSLLWSKQTACVNPNCSALGCAIDQSGNIYVSGHESDTGTAHQAVARKFTSSGQEVTGPGWPKIIGDRAVTFDEFYEPLVDAAGNVYLVGGGKDKVGVGTGRDHWIQKVTADGTLIWEYDADHNNTWDVLKNAALGKNDTYLYAAGYNGKVNQNNQTEDWSVKKVRTADGVEVAAIIGVDCGGNSQDRADKVVVDRRGATEDDDIIYVIGQGTNCLSSTSGQDFIVRKYDANLNEVISGAFPVIDGTIYRDFGFGGAIDNQGNLYATGSKGLSSTNVAWWLRKFDPAGNEVVASWNKVLDLSSSDDFARGVAFDPVTNSIYIGGDYTTAAYGDWWIKKFSTGGTESTTWNKKADYAGQEDRINRTCLDPNNGDVVNIGYRHSGSPLVREWWIRKYKGR